MRSTIRFLLALCRVARIGALACVALLANSGAHAACSPYQGTVVFNEVQEPASGATYFELRILDPNVRAATSSFANWGIDVYKKTGTAATTSVNLNLATAYVNTSVNSCGQNSAWIRIPDTSISNYINGSNPGSNLNFVLYETGTNGNKRMVDLLRLGAATTLFTASNYDGGCTAITSALPSTMYDRAWSSNGNKNWFRTPDGTGPWAGDDTSNNSNSICGSNDATAASTIGLTKVASTTTVNTGVNFTYTLTAQNPLTGINRTNVVVTDTLPTGVSVVSCTPVAPDTCSFSSSAGPVTWTISSLPVNSTRTATLTVSASTTGTKVNAISSAVAGSNATATVTVSNSAPAVTTVAATSVTQTGATLNGSVNPNGASTSVNFGYSGFTGSYINTCTPGTSTYTGSTVQNFSCTLSGLTCNTTYYFRAAGTNAVGTAYGSELSVTTAACASATAGLDAVESGAGAATKIYTKLAGQSFALDVLALQAGGAVDTTYTKTVTPVLVDAASSASCGSMTVLSGVTVSPSSYTYVAGDAGRKSFSFTSTRAAANVRVRMTDTSATPITSCSTDNFAIRPQSFSLSSTNASADTTGTSVSATPVIAAGTNFALTADSGVVGYNGTPALDSSKLSAHSGAIQSGTLSGSFSAANASNGQASGSTFTYSEVGYFTLAAGGVTDSAFAAVDSGSGDCVASSTSNTAVGGKVGCNVGSTASSFFGRFIPAAIVRQSGSVSPACSAGGFSYMGQNFGLAAVLQAQTSGGGVTKNYDGSFARGSVSYAAENADDGTDLGTRLTVAPAGNWSQGVFTLNATTSSFSRLATPDGSYESLLFGMRVVDPDGPALSALDMNPTAVGSASATHKLIDASATKMRFGRLRLSNVSGTGALQMPINLQYWSGKNWVLNGNDSCTVLPLAAVAISNVSGTLAAGTTKACVASPVNYCSGANPVSVGGTSYLKLTPASTTSSGTVSACADLGSDPGGGVACNATGAGLTYLQGRWPPGSNFDNDPAAQATFGIYSAESRRLVYTRELY